MKKKKCQKIRIGIDNREKLRYDFTQFGMEQEVIKLDYKDYTLLSPPLMDHVAVERKTLSDFVSCCSGSNRARFKRELLALRGFRHNLVIIECSLADIFGSNYRSKINYASVLASIMRWNGYGVNFMFGHDRDKSNWLVAKWLELIARDYVSYGKIEI